MDLVDLKLLSDPYQYDLMTGITPELAQQAIDYIFECWGNQKVDLKEWLELRNQEAKPLVLRTL